MFEQSQAVPIFPVLPLTTLRPCTHTFASHKLGLKHGVSTALYYKLCRTAVAVAVTGGSAATGAPAGKSGTAVTGALGHGRQRGQGI